MLPQTQFLDLRHVENIICDGNSITASVGAENSHADELALLEPFLSNATPIRNAGVSGQTTAQMIARAPLEVDFYIRANRTIVIALEIGNHLGTGVAVRAAVDTFWDYCDGRRAKGAYVVACTLHARENPATVAGGTPTEMSGKIDEANGLLRAEWRQHADQLFDCRTVPECSVVTPTYFPDGVHPNAALDVLFTAGLIKTLSRIPLKR
jgi:hypothetical protein